MTLNIEKIRATALAATQGEWEVQYRGDDFRLDIEANGLTIAMNVGNKNATHIAAANPSAVLELIARLEAAEEENAAPLVVIEYIACYLSEREDWHGKNALLQDIALKLASTLAPSTELLEALRKKNAALLVAIEAKDSVLKWYDNRVTPIQCSCDESVGYICTACHPTAYMQDVRTALAISPSTELLEQRDRKRDAKLLRAACDEWVIPSGYNGEILALAKRRESGEWEPELGD